MHAKGGQQMNVEEAKNHRCPLCISFTEQGLSRSGLKITDYVYGNCIADRCMMWRWFNLANMNEGYCGLAGKEGAE